MIFWNGRTALNTAKLLPPYGGAVNKLSTTKTTKFSDELTSNVVRAKKINHDSFLAPFKIVIAADKKFLYPRRELLWSDFVVFEFTGPTAHSDNMI